MSDENKKRLQEELRRKQEQEHQRQDQKRKNREEELIRIHEIDKSQNKQQDIKFYGRPTDDRPGKDD